MKTLVIIAWIGITATIIALVGLIWMDVSCASWTYDSRIRLKLLAAVAIAWYMAAIATLIAIIIGA